MSKSYTLRYGPPSENVVHLCVDMQRMFSEATEWKMPWLGRVLPNVVAITSAHAERTVLTRFIPARKPGQGVGMWCIITSGGHRPDRAGHDRARSPSHEVCPAREDVRQACVFSLHWQRPAYGAVCREPSWRGLIDSWCKSLSYNGIIRARSNSTPARPYMARLRVFSLLICPSVCPLLQGSDMAFRTASRSWRIVFAKRCIA